MLKPDGRGMAASNTVTVTRRGRFPNDNTGPGRSQGEVAGAGSLYAAVLNERPNISNPRNQGPTRTMSRIGQSSIPVAMMTDRDTGYLGGGNTGMGGA